MEKLILFAIVILNTFRVNAQITFQKTYGNTGYDWGYSVQQSMDGGYIVAGYTDSYGAGSEDFYLIKTDSNGNPLWEKTYGGTALDAASSVQLTSDGGYIIVGRTGSFSLNGGVYLVKTDGNGDTLWTKTVGGAGSQDVANDVHQTNDGGYIIAGLTGSFGAGGWDVYLVKTKANGDTLWTKTFGGTGDDIGNAVQQTSDGGYIIVGETTSFGAGNDDVYLIKTNANGDILWTKTYGGIDYDQGNSVQQTSDGGYIIAGFTESFGAGGWDVYLIKTNANGGILWTETYGGGGLDRGNNVQQTSDGGYIVVGGTNSFGAVTSNAYLIKTNTNGNVIWSRTYGGTADDGGEYVRQTKDGGYIIAGANSSFSIFGYDVWLIKTDSNGTSGCDQNNPATIPNTTNTQISSPPTLVSSGGMVTSPATQINSGGLVNSLCSSTDIKPVASFQSNDSTICQNDCINFTNQCTNTTSWRWDFAGGNPATSTDSNPQNVCYIASGSYNVTLIASNTEGSDSLTLTNYIKVKPAPTTPIIFQHHDTLYCNTNPSYTSYQWYADSTIINGATDTLIVVTENGNYNLKVTNSNECKTAVGINVVIGIQNYFSSNIIFLSPNPATNQLTIQSASFHTNELVTVSIMNLLGEIIQEEKLKWIIETSINIKALPAGIYFLQMKSTSGNAVKKFLKE